MKREEILQEAETLINGDRAKDYGDAYENHARIAKLWSAIIGVQISVRMVYLCMIALKIARLVQNEKHVDSWIDICGYGSLGSEDGKEKPDAEAPIIDQKGSEDK